MSLYSVARDLSVVREAAKPAGNRHSSRRAFRRDLPAKTVDASLRRAVRSLDRAEGSILLWFYEMSRRKLYACFGYPTMQQYALERDVAQAKQRTLKQHGPRANQAELGAASSKAGTTEVSSRLKAGSAMSAQAAGADQCAATPEQRAATMGQQAAAPDQHAATMDQPEALPDALVTIPLRFSPMQLARFESIRERLHKARIIPSNSTREEMVLDALDALLEGGEAEVSRQENPAARGDLGPRGPKPSPYHIVIYECEHCRKSHVQTDRGARPLSGAEQEAASCDAIIARPGERRRQTIPPRTKEAVLKRDGHQCRAPGCKRRRYLEIHHVIPRAKGGSNKLGNLAALCSHCHRLWHERGWDIQALRPVG